MHFVLTDFDLIFCFQLHNSDGIGKYLIPFIGKIHILLRNLNIREKNFIHDSHKIQSLNYLNLKKWKRKQK